MENMLKNIVSIAVGFGTAFVALLGTGASTKHALIGAGVSLLNGLGNLHLDPPGKTSIPTEPAAK